MRIACVLLCAVASLAAQTTYTPKPAPVALPAGLEQLVARQFGESFAILADFPTPLITADFNGDGVEDAAIVARARNPMLAQADFGYKVIDPYNDFFGYGRPEVTVDLTLQDPSAKQVLIIHGAGDQAWRAPQPKQKFVIINLPFDRLGAARIRVKKKTITVLSAEETSVLSAVVFWDKKRYRWEPNQLMN